MKPNSETFIESMRNKYFTRLESGGEARDAEVTIYYKATQKDRKHPADKGVRL